MSALDGLVIREAHEGDLPALVAMFAADDIGGHGDTTDDGALPDYLAAFRAIALSANEKLYAAELDGQVVGTFQTAILERFIVKWKQFCWFKRDTLVVRTARVVAKAYGQAVRAIRGSRFNQPKGPGIFPPGSKAIGSTVPSGMPFANRLCPVENLLRQNDSI